MATVIRLIQQRAIFLLLLALVVAPAWAAKPLSSVADLRYGAALYQYYQGKYFEALSELMVAEQRGGIKGHGDNPKLIEGGISLSFGMEQKAGDIFNQLLAPDENGEYSRPLEVRNAAWYYLGKLRYLRGDWDGTEESFSHIEGRFDPSLRPELEALAINLSIRRNKLDVATAQLDKVRNNPEWLPYLYYNLGTAYSRAQQYDQALRYYNALTELPFSDIPTQREEQLALHDKALTAAGYSQLLGGQYPQAIQTFSRIRLDSPLSNRALLGYGWAAAQQEDYALALKPWQELGRRSLVYASVQEAVIAVPFAYEKLGVPGQALMSYMSAETAFEKEIARIDDVAAQLQQLDLLTALNIEDTDNRNWFLLDENNAVEPNLTYLTELFSLNRFQGAVQELRDLIGIQQQLNRWQERLDAYTYMLEQREINRARQLQDIESRQLGDSLLRMVAKRDKLNNELERIVAEKDFLALSDAESSEIRDIVQRVEKNVALLNRAGEGDEEYDEALRRYRGLLYWDASEKFPQRQWQVRKAIKQLDSAIATAADNLQNLNTAMVEAPDIAPYRARIAVLTDRLNTQKVKIDAAVTLAENSLRDSVLAELSGQKARLQHYQSQARLAVARLYDLASREKE